jgi:hypothetical protein
LAVHRPAIVVEGLLDLRVERDDPFHQARLDPVLQVVEIELLDLAGQTRVADPARFAKRLDLVEVVEIGEDLLGLDLKLLQFLELLRLARGGRLPIHPVHLRGQRLDLGHMGLDDPCGLPLLRTPGTTQAGDRHKRGNSQRPEPLHAVPLSLTLQWWHYTVTPICPTHLVALGEATPPQQAVAADIDQRCPRQWHHRLCRSHG